MKIIQKNIRQNISHVVLELKNIEIDVRLPFNIYIKKSDNYVIIIEKGTLLDTKTYNLLTKQKTLYIAKEDNGKQALNCSNLLSYIKYNNTSELKSLSYLYKINAKQFTPLIKNRSETLNVVCIEIIVKSIIFLTENNKSFLKDTIQHFIDKFELDVHSLHVAIYAVNLGYFIGLNQDELLSVGIAGLLHDVGMTKIGYDITSKESKLSKQEQLIIQKHPRFGVEMLKNNIFNPYIIEAIIHHHERYDGSGYPDKLFDKQMSKFSSILAICDVFDALTTSRPYRKKYSSFQALKFILTDASMKNKFNTQYLHIFLKALV